MNWLDTAPVALMCIVWLIVPGLLVSYAIGLRSIAAWAVAPTLSVAVVTMTAVVAGKLGIPWSVPLVLITAVAVPVVAAAVALMLRRRFTVVHERDPRLVTAAAFLGLLPAILVGVVTVVRGLGSPDALSQTFDAVFHYSAVAYILDSHDASTLTMASLGSPSVPPGFYPAGWHDLASLVVMSTGTSIPAAANLLTAVIGMVIWPLGCVLLVRQLAGRSIAAMAITGVISIGFTAFPWGLMSFGVLWPNTLGLALVPAGVAVALSLAGLAKDDAIGRGRAWLLVPPVLLAGGIAHPNSLFSLVVIVVFPLFTGIGRWALRMRSEGRTAKGALGLGAAVVVFFGGWLFVATSRSLEVVRTFRWHPFETASRALGEAFFGATNGKPTLWMLSVVVLTGIVLLWRVRDQRWLIGAFFASAFLFTLTAAVNTPHTQWLTGYWYNDSFRLAAILPITAVPLAVLAIVSVAGKCRDRLAAWDRVRVGRFGTSVTAVTLVLTLVVVALCKGMYLKAHTTTLAENYSVLNNAGNSNILVDPSKEAFYDKIQREIPDDAVVANNPWDGSALIWALIDRKPLFPHLLMTTSNEQQYLAKHLVSVASDPVACRNAKLLNVDYLLVGRLEFNPRDDRTKLFPGIVDPGAKPGFELIDSDPAHDLKLFKLTAC
jgi:hypothetical protein